MRSQAEMRLQAEAGLSRSRTALHAVLLVAALACAVPAAHGADAVDPDEVPAFTTLQVQQAAEAVRADPNLGTERKVRTLKWRNDGEEARGPASIPPWLQWIRDLFGWIGQSARLLVWIFCGLLAAFVAIYLLRLLQGRGPRVTLPAAAPTHVRDLDIRPESLPADIGAAARALWDAGDARRALALLYRGLLSRLAHVHHAPVRDATTEGDTVTLAQRFLPVAAHDYAAGLVNTWSHAVYGDRMPDTAHVHALCDGFAGSLDALPPVSPTAQRGAPVAA